MESGDTMSEEILAQMEAVVEAAMARGDEQAAVACIIEALGPGILGLLLKMAGDEDDACDSFSMFCEDLVKGIASYEGRARLKTWVYRVAIHAHRRFERDPLRRRGRRLETTELDRLVEETRAGTLAFLRTSVKDQFRSLRKHLRPTDQALLTLRLDRGMSWQDIAVVMLEADDPDDQEIRRESQRIRTQYSRIKEKLVKIAQEEGVL